MTKKRKISKLAKLGICILAILASFSFGIAYQRVETQKEKALKEAVADKSDVLPEAGFDLPISWGNLGPRLISAGVIDEEKFLETVNLNSDEESILKEGSDAKVHIDADNGQFVVDLLWAVGLAQKSIVYDEGPLGKEYKNEQGNFASTGGWNLAKGEATDYLNKFDLIPLTEGQQEKVAKISKNVYRPCCGNSTWFPDCNHGMAALAAIEMMVANGVSDEEIYRNILKLNSFWFPGTYTTTATYFLRQGVPWDKVDAKAVLGKEFSSAQGAAEIAKKVNPEPQGQGGSGCGA